MGFPVWAQSGLWGFVCGSALLVGAGLGYFAQFSQKIIATIMAFGSGVLISALSFELMDEAYKKGGFESTAIGFIFGATIYSLANWYLARRGAKNRKRSAHASDEKQPSESESNGSGLAIAIGALLDGIPESIALGISLIGGKGVSVVTAIAIFLSNIPEGLSSSSGMKRAGRSIKYVFGVWFFICVASSISSIVGYALFSHYSDQMISAITAVAAGAILAMISDTMVPEAFEVTHNLAGLATVLGFLASFVLSKSSR